VLQMVAEVQSPDAPTDLETVDTSQQPVFRKRNVRSVTEDVRNLERGFFAGFGGLAAMSAAAQGARGPKPLIPSRQSSKKLMSLVSAAEAEHLAQIAAESSSPTPFPKPSSGAPGPPDVEFVKRKIRSKTEAVIELETGFFSDEARLRSRSSSDVGTYYPRPFLRKKESSRSLLEPLSSADRLRVQIAAESPLPPSPPPLETPIPREDLFVKRTVRSKTQEVLQLESSFFMQDQAPTSLVQQHFDLQDVPQSPETGLVEARSMEELVEEGRVMAERARRLAEDLELSMHSSLQARAFENAMEARAVEAEARAARAEAEVVRLTQELNQQRLARQRAEADALAARRERDAPTDMEEMKIRKDMQVFHDKLETANLKVAGLEAQVKQLRSENLALSSSKGTPSATKTKRIRRDGIRPERIDLQETPVSVPKSRISSSMIVKALRSHMLFSGSSETEMESIADAMTAFPVEAGTTVMSQGDPGDYFYVIESGDLEVIVGGRIVDVAKPGTCFGELALMFGHPRTATIIAKTEGRLWRLGRAAFRRAIHRAAEAKTGELLKFLQEVPLLQSLRDYQRMRIAEALAPVSFKLGDFIQRAGETGTHLYIITKGTVELTRSMSSVPSTPVKSPIGLAHLEPPTLVRRSSTANLQLGVGQHFGERSLMLDEQLEMSARATSDVECYCMDRVSFDRLMGPLRDLLARTQDLRLLESVQLLQQLTDRQRDAVIKAFTHVEYVDGQYIIRQGDEGDAFFIVKSGVVVVTRSKVFDGPAEQIIHERVAGDYFGEMALVDGSPRAGNVVAKSKATLARLSREDFEKLLGPLKVLLERETSQVRAEISHDGTTPERMRLEDLRVLRILGTGAFGKVKLVQHKDTAYALKCLRKSEVVQHGQQEHVKNELAILMRVKHPLIMRLDGTFKDDVNVYLLSELIQGGELFRRLSMVDQLSNGDARFYASNVISCLQYLHDHDIVYRDLKPENLLFDATGYLKLVDFGCAKILGGRTFTLCGSPEYVAPEVLLGKGYGTGVDIWALGVLVYEMAVGFSPFNPSQDLAPMQVCQNIIQAKLSFPRSFTNAALEDFIRGLLTVDPTRRLGMLAQGWEDVKRHPWFDGFDWAEMEAKTMAAPWVPQLEGDLDASCFDEVEDVDDYESPHGVESPIEDTVPGWDADF